MADIELLTGGVPVDALILVTVDNETVFGNGSREHPLRTGAGSVGGFTKPLSLPPQCGIPVLQATGKLDVDALYAAQNVQLSGAGILFLGLELQEGAQIESFNVNLFGNGTTDVIATLSRYAADQTATIVKSVTISNSPGSWVNTIITLDAVDELGPGESYLITYVQNAAGIFFGRTVVTPPTPS